MSIIDNAEPNSVEHIEKLLSEHKLHSNAKIGTAIRWILACGNFYEDLRWGYQFMMPTTKYVLHCWRGKRVPGLNNFSFVPAEESYC